MQVSPNLPSVQSPAPTRPAAESTPQAPTTTSAPATSAPETQPAVAQSDSNQVQTLPASSHEPQQVNFGIGSSLGAAIGALGAALAGAPSKSLTTAAKFITNSNLDDNSLEKSVARTMNERQAAQGSRVDTRASSGPAPSSPATEAPAATPATTTPQPARPERPAEETEQE